MPLLTSGSVFKVTVRSKQKIIGTVETNGRDLTCTRRNEVDVTEVVLMNR